MFKLLEMVDSETSSVIAKVLVPDIGRVGVISESTELDNNCVGSTGNVAIGNASSATDADVGISVTIDGESVSDREFMTCVSSEVTLVGTSLSVIVVGTNSLEAASTEVGAE